MDKTAIPPAELAFAEALLITRGQCGLKQREVAEQMQLAGFTRFTLSTLAAIEEKRRRVYLAEAIGLARVTGMDLITVCGQPARVSGT